MRVEGETWRLSLADGRATTVHTASYSLADTRAEVVHITPEAPLEVWCDRSGIHDAIAGGFSVKPELEPLGDLWVDGRPVAHRAFAEPWHARRAAIAIADGHIAIDYRDRLPARPGVGLLQAGPLLVRDGRSAITGIEDPEGFAATCAEFDEDITAGREPRLAIALTSERIVVLAADGRTDEDAGLTLWELADSLVALGAHSALNLDGGSAAVLVADGRRVNTPRTDEGEDMEASSPTVSAIRFRSDR